MVSQSTLIMSIVTAIFASTGFWAFVTINKFGRIARSGGSIMKLLVVAGHGAGDSGATGFGYTEAERVRALANRMKALGDASVILGDQSINWYRSNTFSSVPKNFDCAIELHMDSAGAGAKGGHVIIKSGFRADNYDNALANFIGGYFPSRSNHIVGRSDLANVNRTASRGINYRLLEVCFISNQEDLNKFNANIDAVARGILSAFGIGASKPVPQTPSKPQEPKDPKHRNVFTGDYDGMWTDWYFGNRKVEGKEFKKISNLASGGYLSVSTNLSSGRKVKVYGKLDDNNQKQAFLLREIKDHQIVDGIGYHIVCAYDESLCLTLNQKAYDNIELQKVKDNDSSQVWFIKKNPNGYSYQIICSKNGKCLSAKGKHIDSKGNYID